MTHVSDQFTDVWLKGIFVQDLITLLISFPKIEIKLYSLFSLFMVFQYSNVL